MIVPDLNLFVYAYNDRAPQFGAARRWWEGLVNGEELVGIPWVVTTGFVRLMTQRGSVLPQVTTEQAMDYVEEWFEHSHVTPLDPGPDHLIHLRRMLTAVGTGGRTVPDAHIAALAIEHDAEVHTHDAGFRHFPGIRWRDPLRTAR